MDVSGVVVPAVMDLVVRRPVRVGEGSVEWTDKGAIDVVEEQATVAAGEGDALACGEEGPGIAVQSLLGGVAFDVGEALVVGEEAVAWSQAAEVVDEEGHELEAVLHVPCAGPEEDHGKDEQPVRHPGQVRRVACVHQDAASDLVKNEPLDGTNPVEDEAAHGILLVQRVL